MARRLLSIWFARLASDTSLRNRPVEGPFALTHRSGNSNHLHCVNPDALARGLSRGMALADAHAICSELTTRPADLAFEAAALVALRRWASRYAPMVASDGVDGLMADISGVPHLFGGEERRGLARRSASAVEPRWPGRRQRHRWHTRCGPRPCPPWRRHRTGWSVGTRHRAIADYGAAGGSGHSNRAVQTDRLPQRSSGRISSSSRSSRRASTVLRWRRPASPSAVPHSIASSLRNAKAPT